MKTEKRNQQWISFGKRIEKKPGRGVRGRRGQRILKREIPKVNGSEKPVANGNS